jgi:hypothetical protein
MAVSLIICAITALESKKNIRFFLWIGFASIFHLSALVVLPLFPLKYVKFKRNIIPLILTGLGIIFCMKFNVFYIILSILDKFNLQYAHYAYTEYYAPRTHFGTGLGVLVKMIPSVLTVFMGSSIIKRYPQKAFVVNLSIIYIWSFFLTNQFTIMGRLRDILVFVPVLVTGFAIQAAGKYKKIGVIVLVFLNLLLLERDIINLPNTGYAKWANPYHSIFTDLPREEILERYND